jgi:hypothetical protein
MMIESDELSGRVDSFESRSSDQQAARDRFRGGWFWLFIGVGIVVALLGAVFGQLGPVILVAYWAGGPLIFLALTRLYLHPYLDRKFPLSRSTHDRRLQRHREAKATRAAQLCPETAANRRPLE